MRKKIKGNTESQYLLSSDDNLEVEKNMERRSYKNVKEDESTFKIIRTSQGENERAIQVSSLINRLFDDKSTAFYISF